MFKDRLNRALGYPISAGGTHNYPTYDSVLTFLNNVYFGTYEGVEVETSVLKSLRAKKLEEFGPFLTRIKYSPDRYIASDFVQSADITLIGKTGDCDDFARFTSLYLDVHRDELGITDVGQAVLFSTSFAHAVAWCKIGDYYYTFDLQSIYKTTNLIDGIYYSFYRGDIVEDVVIYVYGVDSSQEIKGRVTARDDIQIIYPTGEPVVEYVWDYVDEDTYAKIVLSNNVVYVLFVLFWFIFLALW